MHSPARLRSPAVKLAAYAAILAASFGAGVAVGAVFGAQPSGQLDRPPAHDSGHGG